MTHPPLSKPLFTPPSVGGSPPTLFGTRRLYPLAVLPDDMAFRFPPPVAQGVINYSRRLVPLFILVFLFTAGSPFSVSPFFFGRALGDGKPSSPQDNTFFFSWRTTLFLAPDKRCHPRSGALFLVLDVFSFFGNYVLFSILILIDSPPICQCTLHSLMKCITLFFLVSKRPS